MHHSFFQKIVLTLVAGAASAGLIMFYRTVVEKSRYELNEGWRDMYIATPKPKR